MRSKYIPIEMRGQQVSSDTSDIEEKLIKCLRGLLGGEKRVIRTIIFRHVREINPAFLGEFHSASHFIKLRKWFYYDFTRRHNLSIRKLSGVWQNLPLDWKQRLK